MTEMGRRRLEADPLMEKRATEPGAVTVTPPADEIRAHIRERLRDSGMSLYRLSELTGMPRLSLQQMLKEGGSASYQALGRLLYIVDGDDCPWKYERR